MPLFGYYKVCEWTQNKKIALRKIAPRKIAPSKIALRRIALRKIPLRKIAPRKIAQFGQNVPADLQTLG